MDLFAGLDGLGSASSKKLSLAEQRKLKENNDRNTVQVFESLDLLGSSNRSSGFASPGIATSQSSSTRSSVPPEDDDLFGIFNSAPPPKAETEVKAKLPNHGTSARESQTRSTINSNAMNAEPSRRTPLQEPSFKPAPRKTTSSRPNSQASDRNLAQLVDMGFEPEDSRRALEAMNGSVRGAVNWLMAEAQGLPLPEPKSSSIGSSIGSGDFSEFQASASQFGASMFSKASSLFAKGRKELEKAYNQYNNQYGDNGGQPAWMKEKAKYDARARNSPHASASPEPELPSRPSRRAMPQDLDSTPSDDFSDRRTSGEQSSRGSGKPSRAELFRQKQRERAGGAPASGMSLTEDNSGNIRAANSVDAIATSASGSAVSSSPSGESTPDVDLLNLSSTTTAQASLSSTESDLYSASRSLGSEAFRKGDYENAVIHYTAALQVVPEGHALRALLLSNRSAALLKAGNLRAAYDDTSAGIALLPNKGQGVEVDEDVSMPDIWVKLVTRNAQAAENMEKFDAALESWQLLLDNGHASPSILDAKRRCMKALNPEEVKKASGTPAASSSNNADAPPVKKSQRRGWGTTGAMPTSAAGKAALDKVKASHTQQAEEEKQKDLLRDKVNNRVAQWRDGNEKNLRVLLSTLQNVLWDSCEWAPVSLADLVVPKKVRVVYMKAVARTHPDKVSSTAPVEVRMISQSVFVVIQHAWDVFRQENGM